MTTGEAAPAACIAPADLHLQPCDSTRVFFTHTEARRTLAARKNLWDMTCACLVEFC